MKKYPDKEMQKHDRKAFAAGKSDQENVMQKIERPVRQRWRSIGLFRYHGRSSRVGSDSQIPGEYRYDLLEGVKLLLNSSCNMRGFDLKKFYIGAAAGATGILFPAASAKSLTEAVQLHGRNLSHAIMHVHHEAACYSNIETGNQYGGKFLHPVPDTKVL